MKTTAKICALFLAAAVPLLANPILSHKYTADPQPIVWNDRLYVYASNDDQSTNPDDGYMIQAYTLVSTDDMVNWTDHGEVFRVPRDWNRGNATSARAYAPGAAVKGDMVYLYPCGAGGPVGVVTAQRPEGPFNDVKNGVALVQANTCSNCGVPWLFDPAVFVDDDGSGYLYYGGGDANGNPGPGSNMRVIKLNNDMISLPSGANATTVSAPRSFEAAYMHKRGDTYYFSYVNNWAGGDSHPNAAIMYMTGSSPMGPFTLRGPLLRNPAIGNNNINRNNNNHAAQIEFKGKWYIFYHDRRVANANNVPSDNANQRNISVDSLVYNADGTMKEVVVTENGVAQIKNFNPYTTIGATTLNRQSSNPTTNNQPGIKADSVANEGMILTRISNNNWIRLKGVDFGTGATKVTARVATRGSGSIEFRTGSNTGTLVATVNITSTNDAWQNFEANVSNLSGVKDYLYLVFKVTGEPFRLSSYQFQGSSATTITIGCNVDNLQASYNAGTEVPRPNATCSSGTPGTASFRIGETPIDGWNSPGGTHALYNAGTRPITLDSLACGSSTVTPSTPVSCGNVVVVAASSSSENAQSSSSSSESITPIIIIPSMAANAKSEIYDLRGNKVYGTLPSGVYIEKKRGMPSKVFVVR